MGLVKWEDGPAGFHCVARVRCFLIRTKRACMSWPSDNPHAKAFGSVKWQVVMSRKASRWFTLRTS